jgi:site-specific DNA-methyltransferase (adenine-specific)
MDWERDDDLVEKLHPTQKPVKLLKKLIEIFTDEGDVVIDPVAGSGSTLVAALELNRKAYGFEIKKDFHKLATNWVNKVIQRKKDILEFGFSKTEINNIAPSLFQ